MRSLIQRRARSSIFCHSSSPKARTQFNPRSGDIIWSGCHCGTPVLPSFSAFTTSSIILKGGGKQNSKHNVETAAAKVSALPHDDPYNLSDLESRLTQILSRLQTNLADLRPGGRLNPKAIEDLRVQLAKGIKDTEKLGDLAQVVPKGGRSIAIYIGEEAVSFKTDL